MYQTNRNGRVRKLRSFLLATTIIAVPMAAHAQDSGEVDEIIVVGSHIKGSSITGTMPVTVLGQDEIDGMDVSSGDELFRNLPSADIVNFGNSDSLSIGINDARGDVASLNLRGLGPGNTLTLINGRRMVSHPGTKSIGLVPVIVTNTNTLPTGGIERIEVLRDGASAIYGTDAVAGVVNTVLQDDFEGIKTSFRYSVDEHTSRSDTTASVLMGDTLNDGRTNVSLFLSQYHREGSWAHEMERTRSEDFRSQAGSYSGSTRFRNTSSTSPWGRFDALVEVTDMSLGAPGAPITDGDGDFHFHPDTVSGCRIDLVPGLCLDDKNPSSSIYYDRSQEDRMLSSDLDRTNAFVFVNQELENGSEFFSELSYFHAESDQSISASGMLSAVPMTISKDNPYNPFGTGAGRLPNIDTDGDDVADLIGLDLNLSRLRLVDVGARRVNVNNDSFRMLAGFRGDMGSWDYDTAILYSGAETRDVTANRVSNTLLQAALNSSDPATAYNPFIGANPDHPSYGTGLTNSQAVLDSITVNVERENTSSLALADLKFSTGELGQAPGGNIGAAVGFELRRESFKEDRDKRLDGTLGFAGNALASDVVGSSPSDDASGSRDVVSAFAEFAVPLISAANDGGSGQTLDMQIAFRAESFSDVGSVFKPKVALSWVPTPGILFRAAYSQGFRAPNLQQLHSSVGRSNGRTDWYRCQALVNLGTIPDFSSCSESQGVASLRTGSDDLEPETSDNYSGGLALSFADFENTPEFLRNITATVDYWKIEQEDVVGIFGDANHMALDWAMRVDGSSNTNVVRDAPDASDIAFFAGSGLDAVGTVLVVYDTYMNLETIENEGIDFGLYADFDDTMLGDFSFKGNASKLLTAERGATPEGDAINAAGVGISGAPTVAGEGDLMQRESRPEWRASASLSWRLNEWGAGARVNYIGEVFDPDIVVGGVPWTIDSMTTFDVYGQFQIGFGPLEGVRLRIGSKNVTDEEPPLADKTFGYLGAMHSGRGRYSYVSLRKVF